MQKSVRPSWWPARPLSLALTLLVGSLGAAGLGCSDPADPPLTGAVTVGLTSEFRVPTDMVELHITSRVDGEVVRQETRGVAAGQPLLSFPSEVPFGALRPA